MQTIILKLFNARIPPSMSKALKVNEMLGVHVMLRYALNSIYK